MDAASGGGRRLRASRVAASNAMRQKRDLQNNKRKEEEGEGAGGEAKKEEGRRRGGDERRRAAVSVNVGELKRCVAYDEGVFQLQTTLDALGVAPSAMVDLEDPTAAPVAVALQAHDLGREADWLLDGRAVSSLPCECDRCGASFRYVHSAPVRAYLSRARGMRSDGSLGQALRSANEDTFVPVDASNRADLTGTVANAVRCSLPLRLLCPVCVADDGGGTRKEWVSSTNDDVGGSTE